MSSSQPAKPTSLPTLLVEFERLLLLWAEHPDQCDRKRLTHLNHDVCLALRNVTPRPAEYSTYLRRVLHTIKIPIRKSEAIPWEEIRTLRPLSTLQASPTIPKVVLRLPATSRRVGETMNAQIPQTMKRKYVEISTMSSNDDLVVKTEEADIDIMSEASETHRRSRSARLPRPSSKSKRPRSQSPGDEMEIDPSDPASVLTEQCTVCIANGFAVCEKTGAHGACSVCVQGKVKCSLKDRVNEYWKSIGKIGRRSRSRSMSRAPSERKTPKPRQQRKSVTRSTGAESEDGAATKPLKKARITPTSRINDLEVVIADLEERLFTAESKLATVMQTNVEVENPAGPSVIPGVDEAQARHQELEQELAAERREREATRCELRAMSDIVTELWEAFRLSLPPHPPVPAPTQTPPTVMPMLLNVCNLPDVPQTASLAPSDILAQQEQEVPPSERPPLVVVSQEAKDALVNLTPPIVTPTLLNVVNPPDVPRTPSLSPSEILAQQEQEVPSSSERPPLVVVSQEAKDALLNLLQSAVEYSESELSENENDFEIADVIHIDDDRDPGSNLPLVVTASHQESILDTADNHEHSGEGERAMDIADVIPEAPCTKPLCDVSPALVPDHDLPLEEGIHINISPAPESTATPHVDPEVGSIMGPPVSVPDLQCLHLPTAESTQECPEYRCGNGHDNDMSQPECPDVEMDMEMSSRASSVQPDIKAADPSVEEISASPEAPIVTTAIAVQIMSNEDALPIPAIPLHMENQPDDLVCEGLQNIPGEQAATEPPMMHDPSKTTSLELTSEGATVVYDEPKGPLAGRLRQRTPGLDYLRIGNPQAQGSRSKPTSKSDVQGTGLLVAPELSGAEGNPLPPSSS